LQKQSPSGLGALLDEIENTTKTRRAVHGKPKASVASCVVTAERSVWQKLVRKIENKKIAIKGVLNTG
jgi:hypothetical protein